MSIHTTLCGIYPKLISSPDVPHLKSSLHAFDGRRISETELEEVYRANTRQIIKEQREAGITIFTDGLIRWEDFFGPFAKSWDGLHRDTLKRIFDTNTLQRRPRVTGPIVFKPSVAPDDAAYALGQLKKGELLKATIPGPCTFAAECDDEFYDDVSDLTNAIADALNRELRAYQEKGILFVEVYDPILHLRQYDQKFLAEIYAKFLDGIAQTKAILGSFYGTPHRNNLEALKRSPLAGVSLDLVTNPVSIDWIDPKAAPSFLQLGFLDARTTADDDLKPAREKLRKALMLFGDTDLWISLNNSTEFLPRDRAIRKIGRLRELVEPLSLAIA